MVVEELPEFRVLLEPEPHVAGVRVVDAKGVPNLAV